MRTTPEQRAALRRAYVIVGNAGAREVAVLDDIDEALAELAALRAVAEAARQVYEDGVHDLGCAKVRMAEGEPYVSESRDCDCAVSALRAALCAWEERGR